MKILVVGSDTKGAWAMRGVQLGQALGARVTTWPQREDWAWADVVVLVKHAAKAWAHVTCSLSVPVVWDALDFWLQPEENQSTRETLIAQALAIKASAGISLVIGATSQMATDLGGVYLSHHSRIDLMPSPIRATPQAVGYDGQKKYLGQWLAALESVCHARGITFVVNPQRLSDVDVLVAFRDGRWDGWACQAWKSGIKYVNAVCAGRPIITSIAAGALDVLPVTVPCCDRAGLPEALDAALSTDVRQQAYEDGMARWKTFKVEAIAQQYRALIAQHLAVAA